MNTTLQRDTKVVCTTDQHQITQVSRRAYESLSTEYHCIEYVMY